MLAADKLLEPLAAPGVTTLVLTDPTVWSCRHLLRCAASQLRLAPPLLPLLPLVRLLLALPTLWFRMGQPIGSDDESLLSVAF